MGKGSGRRAVEDIPLHKIRAFVDGRTDELAPAEQVLLSRLSFAYDQLKTESVNTTVARLQQKFEITGRQAYNDIERCKRLFNPIYKADLEWIENFIFEDIKRQILVARAEGNHSAWNTARSQMIKMYAIVSAKSSELDLEQLGNNNYYVVVTKDNTMIKLDLDKVHELPAGQRTEIAHSMLLREIDEETAQSIMHE